MKAIIYTRVSTHEQTDNHSLATQLEACRHYARQHGLEVVGEYQDSLSGELLEREGLNNVREHIRSGQVEALIVHSADRLSRNLAHVLLLRDERKQHCVTLHTVTRGASSESAESQLFDNIEGAFAEYERMRIRERFMRGARGKVTGSEQTPGRILGHGKAPYGYLFVGRGRERTIEIISEEAAVVRRIYRLYMQGESLRAIADQLTADGIPTPHDSGRYHTRRRSRPAHCWHQMVVWRVLRRDIYAGILYHYRVRRAGKKGKLEPRSREEWVGVPVPAIVDAETFQAVQQRIEQAQQRSSRNSKHFYLLGRGRLTCECGTVMSGTTSPPAKPGMPPRRYYRCRANTADAVQRCSRPRLNADRVEQAVWEWVQGVLTPESIARGVALEEQQTQAQRATLDADVAALEQRRAALEQEHTRMLQAYKAGILTMEELARDKAASDAALNGIDSELARLDRLRRETPCFDVAALHARAQALRLQLAHLNDEEKIRLLDLLRVRVVRVVDDVGGQCVDVVCVIEAGQLAAEGALCHSAQGAARCHSPA